MADMTFAEFMNKVQTAFPGATVGEDNDGQLIIYTNLREQIVSGEETIVIPMDPED